MTAMKCIGVRSASFAGLQRYIERDEKFMGRRTLNIADEAEWAREMDATAAIEGVPGRTKTRGYHIVLGFRPDQVTTRLRDGSVDVGRFAWCLDYAEEFCRRQMPGLQCAIGAHLETSDADGSERIAVHIVASRSVLDEFAYPDKAGHVARAGTLFDRSPSVVRSQIACVRSLDDECGLKQLRRGRNVADRRARGRTGKEREMLARGAAPWKEEMRRALVDSVGRSLSLAELEQAMGRLGFSLDLTRSKSNITVIDGAGHRARVSTLGVTRERIEEIISNRAVVARQVEGLPARAASHRPRNTEGVRKAPARVAIAQLHVTLTEVHVSIPAHRPEQYETDPLPGPSELQARMVAELLRLAEQSRLRASRLLEMESSDIIRTRHWLEAAARTTQRGVEEYVRRGRTR